MNEINLVALSPPPSSVLISHLHELKMPIDARRQFLLAAERHKNRTFKEWSQGGEETQKGELLEWDWIDSRTRCTFVH